MKYINEKIADKVEQYYKYEKVVATNFLDPSEIVNVKSELKYVDYISWGGFENAERKIILIGLDIAENEVNDFAKEYITVLRVDASGETLTHRNVLGSVLGLGIKREMIGDIIVQKDICDIIVSKSIVEYLLNNLNHVGNIKVKIEEVGLNEIVLPEDTSKEVKTTVSSLRVDNIISAGYGVSREKSTSLVKSELVKLNHIIIKSPVKAVRQGDLISVRGKGRLEIKEIGGTSKSGRIKITLIRK